jgi:hypothetical protein
MPKILINEKDKTSPGNPNSYSNFSVLLLGFQKEFTDTEMSKIIAELQAYDAAVAAIARGDKTAVIPTLSDNTLMFKAREKLVDSNGVYEFSSAEDFKNTIGLRAPEITDAFSDKVSCHYGNQMAYELLNMGYSIIYKPITSISELAQDSTWEIFKDKASYDFRFITHGLLESSEFSPLYNLIKGRIEEVQKAIDELKALLDRLPDEDESGSFDRETELLTSYQAISKDYPGFCRGSISSKNELIISETPYTTYYAASDGTSAEMTYLNTALTNMLSNDGIETADINNANKCIAKLATYVAAGTGDNTYNDFDAREIPGRGDCVALIELDENVYTNSEASDRPENLIITAINEMTSIDTANGKYCAMTVPSVVYKMTDYEKIGKDTDGGVIRLFNNNKKFPGAFHYLACFINSLQLGFAEWYAAAGYTRGVASYMIDYTTVRLGEIAINALEPRNITDADAQPKFACNVIANFRGSYYLWGNRTAHPLGTQGDPLKGDLVASSFLNIRHLCTTIKKQLYVACRRFTFDPNSDTLWINFCNAIRPTLEAMKADQGIRDFKIIKVFTDKKATLKAKIRIIPIEAVEDFDLEVSLEDSFGETAAVVTE